MDTSSPGVALLLAGVLMGVVVLTQAVAVSHLSIDSIPACLRHRVEMTIRLLPVLGAVAVAMALAGLVLHLR